MRTKTITGAVDQQVKRQVKDERKKRSTRSAGPKSKAGRLLAGTLVVLLAVYVVALFYLRPATPGMSLSLDALNRIAVCGSPRPSVADPALDAYCRGVDKRIMAARLLDEDSRITGTLEAGGGGSRQFWTSYPKSDAATNDLIKNLYSSAATVTVDPQSPKQLVRFLAQFLLPLVVLANLFALLFLLIQRGGSGASEFLSFGRAPGKRKTGNEAAQITFADVAAADEAITELAEVRDYLADPSAFAEMGALPPKGVLLFGPPGCGKTLLARAVAGEAKASFYSMSGSEFVEALVGVGAARVRDLFAQARANAPAVIFIDELDAVGRKRGAGLGQGHDEREQTLNEMLVQMDGFSPSLGIVAIGATNRPDILDPALLRSGRFDRHVTLDRPDVEGRDEILRLHAKGRRLSAPDSDVPQIARASAGFTGADLANVINEAALLAVRERAGSIARHHLEEAVERVRSGPRRKGTLISPEEKHTIAYHEAGHAVVAAALGKAAQLQKVSIMARGRGIAHLAMLSEDKTIFRRGDMEATIAIAMAGFATEELVFGEPSSGAEQDLERATTTARDMAGRYGMSMRLGPIRVLREDREVFLGRDYLATRDVSQPTLEQLDGEVLRIVGEQKEIASSLLASHRDVLDALASELAAHETLQGAELAATLGGVEPYDKAKGRVSSRPARARPST